MNKNTEEINISVIVATYNPQIGKLKRTIQSILIQENIKTEILICDDCSKPNIIEEVAKVCKCMSSKNINILKSMQNNGTVMNIYNGIKHAKGRYIYCISPGDYLYDKNTLRDLFYFADEKHAEVVFGDAVYYSDNAKKGFQLVNNIEASPHNVKVYNDNISLKRNILHFFLDVNYILGPTLLRTREYAIKYIGILVGKSKYVEDNTSCAFALADNVRHYYYNQYVVWYEYGTGVSTKADDKWKTILQHDYDNSFVMLEEYASENKLVRDLAKITRLGKKEKIRYLLRNNIVILVYLVYFKINKGRKRKVNELPIKSDMMVKLNYKITD